MTEILSLEVVHYQPGVSLRESFRWGNVSIEVKFIAEIYARLYMHCVLWKCLLVFSLFCLKNLW